MVLIFVTGWRPSSAVCACAYVVPNTLRSMHMVILHTLLALCMLLTIEFAAVPTPFAELLRKLWRGFLLTLVCEAIMSTMIILYGRLV